MMPMNLVFCHYNWPLVFLFSWKSQEDVLRFNYFSYEFDWIFFSSLLLQLSRRFYLLIAVIFNPNWFILIFRVFTHFSFMHTRCLMNCLCDYRFTLCWCLCDYRFTLCWYLCGYRFTQSWRSNNSCYWLFFFKFFAYNPFDWEIEVISLCWSVVIVLPCLYESWLCFAIFIVGAQVFFWILNFAKKF